MNTKGHCDLKCITLQAVYFKLRFTLSYHDVEEIMKIREVLVEHKYFNNIVEQDRRFIKWRIQNGLGFKSFESAKTDVKRNRSFACVEKESDGQTREIYV